MCIYIYVYIYIYICICRDGFQVGREDLWTPNGPLRDVLPEPLGEGAVSSHVSRQYGMTKTCYHED